MIVTLVRCLVLCVILSGCESLPATGPRTAAIMQGGDAGAYQLVMLDSRTAATLGPAVPAAPAMAAGFSRAASSGQIAATGDRLAIHIWEAAPDALFADTGRKRTQIDATVDAQQRIFVPYAGQINVAGQRPDQIRDSIAARLAGQTIDPQVQVSFTQKAPQLVTVTGAVAAPGQVTMPAEGLQLIGALALSGGVTMPAHETEVTWIRGHQQTTARLDQMLAMTGLWLRAGDSVILRHQPRSFTSFGALGRQSRQMFTSETMTLAEAIGQTGGLNDALANARGVFVYRHETAARLSMAGLPAPHDPAPVIYHLDLSLPDAFFAAAAFHMRDRDILYVSNAPATDLRKFTQLLLSGLGAANTLRAAETP